MVEKGVTGSARYQSLRYRTLAFMAGKSDSDGWISNCWDACLPFVILARVVLLLVCSDGKSDQLSDPNI